MNSLDILSDREYEIVCFVRNVHRTTRTDVVNHFSPEKRCVETNNLISSLSSREVLSVDLSGNVSLTSHGFSVLSRSEDVRREKAKEEKEKSLDRKIGVAQVVVPLATFFLGVAVEHFSGMLSFLLSVFR